MIQNNSPWLERGLGGDRTLVCVDVGHTRTKMCVLACRGGVHVIEATEPAVYDSAQFLGEGGFRRLCAHLRSWAKHSRADGLGLCVGCPVDHATARAEVWPSWQWPESMADALERETRLPTVFANDAVAFALGVGSAPEVRGLLHPVLCLTLGSGIGVALRRSPREIRSLEARRLHRRWEAFEFEGDPHGLAGEAFFHFVRRRKWSERDVKQGFTARVGAIVEAASTMAQFRGLALGGHHAGDVDEKLLPACFGTIRHIEFARLTTTMRDFVALRGLAMAFVAAEVEVDGATLRKPTDPRTL